MELAKKVNDCFIEINKDVEMEPANEKPEQCEIDTLLDEGVGKLSLS